MRTYLACYATPAFAEGQRRLVASAARFGLDEVRAWTRPRLESTAFYRAHRTILDLRRGGGFWLWKPYIVAETLAEMAPGDRLFYADAGIEIVRDLAPLVELSRRAGEVGVFAGHYQDLGVPGPNVCRRWTKRDCFVLMGVDAPAYHEAPMLDASFLVLTCGPQAQAFVQEWLRWCTQRILLTDEANSCGLPDLPGFVGHRHDQSILSLLAARDRLELFRHPSQFGNHLKPQPFREPGEALRFPYGQHGLFENSPYPTLLDHHRLGRSERLMRAPRWQERPCGSP